MGYEIYDQSQDMKIDYAATHSSLTLRRSTRWKTNPRQNREENDIIENPNSDTNYLMGGLQIFN